MIIKNFDEYILEQEIHVILKDKELSVNEKQEKILLLISNSNLNEGIIGNVLNSVKNAAGNLYRGVFGDMLDVKIPSIKLPSFKSFSIKNAFKSVNNSISKERDEPLNTEPDEHIPVTGERGYNSEIHDKGGFTILIESDRNNKIMNSETYSYPEQVKWRTLNDKNKTLDKHFFPKNIFKIIDDNKKFRVTKIWTNKENFIEEYLDEYHIKFKLLEEDYFFDIYIKNKFDGDIEAEIYKYIKIHIKNMKGIRYVNFIYNKPLMEQLFKELKKAINTNEYL